VARAAATAYEVILEYLEDGVDRIKAINPLKMKQKKLNLLTDHDEDVSVSYIHHVLRVTYLINFTEYLSCRLAQDYPH